MTSVRSGGQQSPRLRPRRHPIIAAVRGARRRRKSEDEIVSRIAGAFRYHAGDSASGLQVGIGDDAAVITGTHRSDWILTCDAFLEDVHFLARLHPPESVGHKALVRATSDVVAMGGTPRYFLLTLGLPPNKTKSWLDRMLLGMQRAARGLNLTLAGGDTTAWAKVAMSITVVGEVDRGSVVKRSGAKPGDPLYVSGTLGAAGMGLALVRKGMSRSTAAKEELRAHLYPRLRVELGRWLAERRVASSMMDISDGLSTDLARLCRASGVGARLRSDQIPLVPVAGKRRKLFRKLRLDPLELALNAGDDYELLFTVPPRRVRELRRAPDFGELRQIGKITRETSIVLESEGSPTVLEPRGWDPFRTG
jgi:thiamine-monophosphate kinase